MKPPNIPSPSLDPTLRATTVPAPPQPSTTQTTVIGEMVPSASSVMSSLSSQPVITKPQQTLATSTQAVQQVPLALTTQSQTKMLTSLQGNTTQIQAAATTTNTTVITATTIPSAVTTITTPIITQTTTASNQLPQITQIQAKIQPNSNTVTATPQQLQQTTATTIVSQSVQPITITASTPTASGPTALVIIPQHSTNTSVTQLTNKTAATFNSSQLKHAPNRPPSTLPVVPITTAPTNVKTEPNKYICCLLDNGVRCDRVAGNASFSARIQKIVGTKKMNFVLDPTVRHAYICEHHKAIITVAKKSTTLARDTKASARNYNNNNNAGGVITQAQYNDMRQQTLQHPVNLELINRTPNNHTGNLNNMSVRQGSQIAFGHYPGANQNQVGSMDVMMSSGFNSAGGDSVPSCSGGVDVDLQQLQVNTLRRYKRHFRVQTRPGLNKMQLAESLKTHFRTLPIIEKEAITYFVYIVKCYRNKLDHNPKAD